MSIQRKDCIVCREPLIDLYFKDIHNVYIGHYPVQEKNECAEQVPYNIFICSNCNTPQLQTLGSPDEIYRINHADSTGKLMNDLHMNTKSIVESLGDKINGIVEIGSAYGVLSDIILKDINTSYTIIEPTYNGTTANKKIIPLFVEEVNPSNIDANILIISHVFEHIYKPCDILEKIIQFPNLEYFILVFPDLEYYINNNILHVLNTEHTFYVDNTFLKAWIESYGFRCLLQSSFKNHSVSFLFEKTTEKIPLIIKNINYNLDIFFNKIKNTIATFNNIIDLNKTAEVYLWPASIHTLTLLNHGLSTKITGLLDNSLNKINKYIYGYNLPILSFKSIIEEDISNRVVLCHGGVFNQEIENIMKNLKNTKYILGE